MRGDRAIDGDRGRDRTGWFTRLIVVASVLAACGQGSRTQPGPVRVSEPGGARVPSPQGLSGSWQWSLVSEKDGARQVEQEFWQIAAEGGTLTGHYDRLVTFLSADGVPFVCNQDLRYLQKTRYALTGTYQGSTIEIREASYDATPSSCDEGYRTLVTYRAEMRDGKLVLHWPAGTQTLVRATEGSRTMLAEPTGQLAGSWRWQSRNERRGEVEIETEDWDITEEPGTFAGTVTRTVTVFDPEGRRYECSGDTFFQYRDRYTIRGQRTGDSLALQETAVTPGATACLEHTERHLDAAMGSLEGDHIVLTWRGNRRQVLHRPDRPDHPDGPALPR